MKRQIILAGVLLCGQASKASEEGNQDKVIDISTSAVLEETSTGSNNKGTASLEIEVSIDAKIHQWADTELVLLYENESDSPSELSVDTALLNIANPTSNWQVSFGKYTLPFGVFETNLISDSLTLDLVETVDIALAAEVDIDNFNASLYVFDGNQHSGTYNFGLNLGSQFMTDKAEITTEFAYINDIAESEAIVDDATPMINRAGALAASVVVQARNYQFITEYVSAIDSIGAYAAEKPSALNVEASVAFNLLSKPSQISLSYQVTHEAKVTAGGLAKDRILAGYSASLSKNVRLGFEYLHQSDYEDISSKSLSGQLAMDF